MTTESRANAVGNYTEHTATMSMLDVDKMPPIVEVGEPSMHEWIADYYAAHPFEIPAHQLAEQIAARFKSLSANTDVTEASISFEGMPTGAVLLVKKGDQILARRYWEAVMRKKRFQFLRNR